MRVRSDPTLRAVVDTTAEPSIASPESGVRRVLLDRDGDEVARSTSVVTYAPGSSFFAHTHPMGEEFLVLAGTFCDEHGTYPRGTYVRNPWGSQHAPFAPTGCVIFVKLRQMALGDRQRVCVERAIESCMPTAPRVMLHTFETEEVWLERWPAGHCAVPHAHPRGEEFFVLEGSLEDEHGRYDAGTWCRQPVGSAHEPSTRKGCLLFMKRGP